MAILKSLAEIRESDLLNLIANEVREGQTLEFKRQLSVAAAARPEFFRDISSFANASGGDIVFGLDDDSGVAKGPIRALNNFDADRTPLTIRDLCLQHIDPPIHGLQSLAVSLEGGGHALIIRVPQTWNRPHMITYDDDNRFWRRDGPGKRPMTSSELREAFTLSASTVERIRAFRSDRLNRITKLETPVNMVGSVFVVLHLFPLVSFEASKILEIQEIFPTANSFLKPLAWPTYDAMSQSFNLDGILSTSSAETGCLSYAQLFRNGCIEAVDSGLLRRNPSFIHPAYERYVGEALPSLLGGLERHGINTPIFLGLSLLNVRGFSLPRRPDEAGAGRVGLIREANLVLPEVQLDEFRESYFPTLKPVFDIVWQAGGQPGSHNYAEDGSWNYLWR